MDGIENGMKSTPKKRLYSIVTPWKAPDGPDFGPYLYTCDYCDFDHPDVRASAARLINGVTTAREAALAIFYFVRDQIAWAGTFDERRKASEVLQSRLGACFNKATLQVALLRAVNIPARYRFQIFPKRGFKKYLPAGLATRIFMAVYPDEVPTAFAELYLENRWLSAATTMDKSLNPFGVRDWDGRTDLRFLKNKKGYELNKNDRVTDGGTSAVVDRLEYDYFENGFNALGADKKRILYQAYQIYLDAIRFKMTLAERSERLIQATFDDKDFKDRF